MLSLVLDEEAVVEKLTTAVHRSLAVHDDFLNKISGVQLPDVLNVWIDPIGR